MSDYSFEDSINNFYDGDICDSCDTEVEVTAHSNTPSGRRTNTTRATGIKVVCQLPDGYSIQLGCISNITQERTSDGRGRFTITCEDLSELSKLGDAYAMS